MSSEQFSLCWDNFHKNMSMGMQSLLETEDLVDVTLAVEGRYLKAHKMVLSVCSPYFRELFQSNPCKHPIVFMKDVSYIALSDLLHFMYQGKVQVAQENLSTFIKTAEALQIKGLTGDGEAPNDSESEQEPEKVVVETTAKRSHDTSEQKSTNITKPKRFSGPASKRPKFSTAPVASSSPSPVLEATTENKYEVAFINSNAPSSDDINLKMEPNETLDQSQTDVAEDSQMEECTEESTAFEMTEETEDFSLIESSNDEPKPGTSTEAGDNQDVKQTFGKEKKRINTRMRFVIDGFVYHNNLISGQPPLRYLGCAENKRAGCHGRAILPLNGTSDQIKITQPHNHPPDGTAEEKYSFVHQLKSAVRSMESATLKKVYETVAELYPQAAAEIPFRSLSSSLYRWRHNPHIYLACAEIKRSGCRARAILPVGMACSYLRLTHPHNHPPNENAEERESLVNHLKQAVRSMPGSLRKVYDTISILYPKGAEELPFKSICSSLHRWRRDLSL